MPDNLSYFEKRTANNVWRTYNNLEKDVGQLIEMYDLASKEVTMELYKIAEKLERDGMISRSEFYRGRHLQKLSASYKQTLQELGDKVEDLGEKTMLEGAEVLYGKFSEETGILINYDRTALMRLSQEQWHGANFSQRVWKNQEKLLNELRTTISSGIRTGKTITQIAIGLHNKMQSGLNNAFRLVRTETMHHLNEVNKQAMKDSGVVQKVKEVVTQDERTSDQCAPHHGKIHDIDNAPILPRHPNCRCVLVPYIDVDALVKQFEEEEVRVFGQSRPVDPKDVLPVPVDKELFKSAQKAFERQGGVFARSKEIDYHLERLGAEASTLNSVTILFRSDRLPTRSALFEELIHATQYREGRATGENWVEMEIEVKEKLIKYQNQYKISDEETTVTKAQLEALKSK